MTNEGYFDKNIRMSTQVYPESKTRFYRNFPASALLRKDTLLIKC